MPDDRPALVLVNPGAGSAEQETVEEVCRALADAAPSGVEVQAPDTDSQYARAVATAAGRDVVVIGGDGSVHRLLQELHDQDLLARCGPVGLVPMGTGNDLARHAGIPLTWQEAVPVAVRGRPAVHGLLLGDDGRVVVNAAHTGVGAEATAHVGDSKGLLGRAAYAVGALQAGLTELGWHLRVILDGRTLVEGDRRVLMVTVALGSTVGGGTPVAPQSGQDDAVADVVVALGTSPAARVGYAFDLRKGTHTERPDVLCATATEVVVEAVGEQDAFRVNTDGEVSEERVMRRRWRVVPDAWTLRVP